MVNFSFHNSENRCLYKLKNLMRLTKFDVNSSEGRSRERHRRIALTVLSSGLAKVITIITSLITVPLTLNYLGAERYGLWMTISSVIAMMVFADFGIGNGLMNAISEAFGEENWAAMRSYVSSALVAMLLIAISILLVFLSIYPFVNWGTFFNVKTPTAIQEAGPALATFMACFALGVPASIVQRVQLGIQQGFLSSIWLAFGSLIGLGATLLAIHLKAGLPWLVLSLAGAPVFSLLLNSGYFFFFRRRDLLPRVSCVSRFGMNRILRGGMLFFALQLAVSLSFASDNIILAKMMGNETVAKYSVITKLFEGILMMIGIIFTPFWPAFGEAKTRGDHSWIKAALGRSMGATLVMTLFASLFVVLFYERIFAWWVGSKIVFSFGLVFLYSVWMVLKGLGVTYSMFLNGMNAIRLQLIIASTFTVVSIIAKIVMVSAFGINGLIIAMICVYSVCVVLPYAHFNNRILSQN